MAGAHWVLGSLPTSSRSFSHTAPCLTGNPLKVGLSHRPLQNYLGIGGPRPSAMMSSGPDGLRLTYCCVLYTPHRPCGNSGFRSHDGSQLAAELSLAKSTLPFAIRPAGQHEDERIR